MVPRNFSAAASAAAAAAAGGGNGVTTIAAFATTHLVLLLLLLLMQCGCCCTPVQLEVILPPIRMMPLASIPPVPPAGIAASGGGTAAGVACGGGCAGANCCHLMLFAAAAAAAAAAVAAAGYSLGAAAMLLQPIRWLCSCCNGPLGQRVSLCSRVCCKHGQSSARKTSFWQGISHEPWVQAAPATGRAFVLTCFADGCSVQLWAIQIEFYLQPEYLPRGVVAIGVLPARWDPLWDWHDWLFLSC
jgi:hypothetical protein